MPLSTLRWRAKRLRYLLQRVQGSLTQRGLRKTWARIQQEFRTHPAEETSLKLVPLDAPFSPFAIQTSETPQVSIVIPVHGKCAWTVACLRSIQRHGARTSFEIIVVDDTSPDDTVTKLSQVHGIRLLQNQANLGFVGSCNAGAKIAHAPFLLFLNNDTQVTPGWLDALLETYLAESDCGIVGSQLI